MIEIVKDAVTSCPSNTGAAPAPDSRKVTTTALLVAGSNVPLGALTLKYLAFSGPDVMGTNEYRERGNIPATAKQQTINNKQTNNNKQQTTNNKQQTTNNNNNNKQQTTNNNNYNYNSPSSMEYSHAARAFLSPLPVLPCAARPNLSSRDASLLYEEEMFIVCE